MNVPLLDLQPQVKRFREEILQVMTEVVDSTRYILGPKVTDFEQQVADYSGVPSAVGVSSGTDALLVSLMALEIGAGDLVLTTPYTFFATMGAIIRVGAMPVFADVEEGSLNIDPEKMAEVLAADQQGDKKIKAILPVHLFGQCADMTKIMRLADQYGIPVIEDAAQAIGAECPAVDQDGGDGSGWQRAGSMGIAGCFSFFPSKNLGCIGDGGIVTCRDSEFAETLRCYRNHGAKPKYYHSRIGGNFRLDPIQAAVLSVKLPHLPEWHQQRRDNAALYRKLFQQAGLTDVVLPTAVYSQAAGADQHDYHIYNQFVIRVSRRDELRTFLQEQSIGCEVYYPVCLHKQNCLAEQGYGELSFPVAEQASKDSLALPIYPELSHAQQEYVVENIARFYES